MVENYKTKKFNDNKIPSKKSRKTYICKDCGKVLSSKENYLNHIEKKVCKKEPFKCPECNKIFTSKQNLQYHINYVSCTNNNISKILKSPIRPNTTNNTTNKTNNNADTTNNTSNNTTNIQNQQNIQNQNNNIQNNNNVVINVNSTKDLEKVVEMLPFRDASYKISTKKYLEYANNPEQAIKKFVKDEHLNPAKPERLNILNTNPRSNRVQLFDYDDDFICRWQTKNKTDVAELLFDRGVNILFFAKTMLSAAGIKLDPKKETQLNAKIKEYESNDKVKKKYINMITDLTYDYRDVVELNKKNIEYGLIEN